MLPQHLVKDVGGTVWIDVKTLPTAATVDIYTGAGAKIVDAQAATISTISTTLSAAAEVGTREISVASATGLSRGVDILLGGFDRVRVRAVSGTDVTLWNPLLVEHESGVAVKGMRVSYAVLAASVTELFFDGRVKWTFDDVVYDHTSVECTLYNLRRSTALGATELFTELPNLAELLNSDEDPEKILDDAHETVLTRIGTQHRTRVIPGSELFKEATVYAACVSIFMNKSGESGTTLYERYMDALQRSIDSLMAIAPRDACQDGTSGESDKVSFRSGRVYRA